MKVLRVEDVDVEKGRTGRFRIWVWARDDPFRWKECPFGFKYEDGQVYFLLGGQEPDRLIGEAQSKDEAVKKAEMFLEGWLRERGGID